MNIYVNHAPSPINQNQCWFCLSATGREIQFEVESIRKDPWGHDNGTIRKKSIPCCDNCWPSVCQAFGGDPHDA